MAESNNNNQECKSKQELVAGKFLECSAKLHVGTTCNNKPVSMSEINQSHSMPLHFQGVCHKVPAHSRTYYGHLFCIECFHKYIWSPAKGSITCSGDLKNQLDETCELLLNEEGTSK